MLRSSRTDRSPRAVLDFTPNKSALLAALGQIQYTIGMDQLNLYDSVSAVLDWLGPSAGKKTLVLLTTGARLFGGGSLGSFGEETSR